MEDSFECKESSNLDWVRYKDGALFIDFKKNGVKVSTYRYDGTLLAGGENPTGGFPPLEYENLKRSVSPGRYFAAMIRPRYKGVKQ